MSIECTCLTCGNTFLRWPSQVRDHCNRFCRYPRIEPVWNEDGLSVQIHVRHPKGEPFFATIDAEDFALVNPWKWGLTKNGYAEHIERADGRVAKVLMHRLIMGLERGDGKVVDHIDRNRLNNRKSNLRLVTPLENSHNRGKMPNGSSSCPGVSWGKRTQKWQAAVRIAGRYHWLGYFTEEGEAIRAVQEARARLLPSMYA